MSRSKDYITGLLDRIPKWELPLIEHRNTFDSIKDRLLGAEDLEGELRHLFKVRDYGDFALSLLWIVERVEKNPALEESTEAEQTLVFNTFRKAVGDAAHVSGSESGFVVSNDESQEMTEKREEESASRAGELPALSGENFGGDPVQFGRLFDRLTEAVQTGDESRAGFIAQILQECAVVAAGDFSSDFRRLCTILAEFLQYVTVNQFLDDIRVMNLVQNVQDPISQWSNADPSAREGLLDQALQVLQDYKQMFE